MPMATKPGCCCDEIVVVNCDEFREAYFVTLDSPDVEIEFTGIIDDFDCSDCEDNNGTHSMNPLVEISTCLFRRQLTHPGGSPCGIFASVFEISFASSAAGANFVRAQQLYASLLPPLLDWGGDSLTSAELLEMLNTLLNGGVVELLPTNDTTTKCSQSGTSKALMRFVI